NDAMNSCSSRPRPSEVEVLQEKTVRQSMEQQIPKAGGASMDLARNRTSLASYRTQLALDRTTLAWIRTTLTMASFGFGMVSFFRSREHEHRARKLSDSIRGRSISGSL